MKKQINPRLKVKEKAVKNHLQVTSQKQTKGNEDGEVSENEKGFKKPVRLRMK